MSFDIGLYIAKGTKGFGVYAGRTIRPGEEILRFTGPLIDFEGTLRLGEREGDALQIGPNLYVHLDEPGSLVNHSCLPNAGIVDDLHLVALEPIHPHQEICYDYSTSMDDGHWTMECLCGESICRGRIRDFRKLPDDLQAHYLRRGIVQSYLARTVPSTVERSGASVSVFAPSYSNIDAK